MDYCTVKLAPTAAKLTVFFSCDFRQKNEIILYHNTRREQWLGYCFSKGLPYEVQAILVQNKRNSNIVDIKSKHSI